MPRRYSSRKRAEKAQETRRRIVEAAFALHAERGIQGTRPQDIAARADVALTTYYKHFPTVGELVRACGARGMELTPPPDPAILAGLPQDPAAQIEAAVRALFAFYEAREEWLYTGWTEERFIPEIQFGMAHLREMRAAFVRGALALAAAGPEAVGVATALADFWAWHTLRREVGLTQEHAIDAVVKTVARITGIAPPAGGTAESPAGQPPFA